MVKHTIEVDDEQLRKLHEACPELFAAPKPKVTTWRSTPLRVGMSWAQLRASYYRDGEISLEISDHKSLCPLDATKARELARALIVAAGELEGRSPESAGSRRALAWAGNPHPERPRPERYLERWALAHIDGLLEFEKW